MSFSWVACEALTGNVIADLPLFSIDACRLTLGRYETATGTMPIDDTLPEGQSQVPENWLYAIEPFSSVIILRDDSTGNAIWGGYTQNRTRTSGDTVTIPLVTAEGYLDRVYVGDSTFTATDQNTIATTLVSIYAAAALAGIPGIPITTSVSGAAGTTRDRTYQDVNDQTLYTALTELMGVQGGPEWTISWQHLSSPERYVPVFNVGSMIGNSVSAGMGPNATFEMGGQSRGGSVTEVTYTEDYTSGKGANYVKAVSTPNADGTRQTGIASVGSSSRRPHVEYRWNPSTSITDTTTLLQHAWQTLPIMQTGARSLALASKHDEGPQLGVDFNIGDVVGYSIGGLDQYGNETVPAFAGGLQGTARVIGWQLQPDVPTPIVTPVLGGV